MEKEYIIITVEINISVIKEKVLIIGLMVVDIQVIGKMIQKKEKENGLVAVEIYMKAIIKIIYQMEKEFIYGMMVVNIQAIGKII